MLIFNSVGLCLFGFFACVIVSMPIVQGRSPRRYHRHHYSHPNYYDFAESHNSEYHDSYEPAEKRGYPRDVLNHFSGNEEQILFPRRYNLRDLIQHRQKTRNIDASSSMKLVARRKRHNKHGGKLAYQVGFTEPDREITQWQHDRDMEKQLRLEFEVKEAQNKSICNYTVETIPDTRGSRVPRNLENVKCNHIGSDCQGSASCCVQTYKNIEVSYGDGYRETMKIYVGCVCANKEFDCANHLANVTETVGL
ncbi:uncharacterized protein LOC109861426 [Pseudomyrmex gracilis]|uniref:uncharacterized protein LOC109861426 n=1 Tax=Pseudomyrmex gracilis TaxID=219809 RepID=UPI000995865F|nr:uncharacterized protein LOC109861426 [Pseudomyrmex gracilis]